MNKLIYTLALGLLIVSCQNKKSGHDGHEHHQPEAASATQPENSKKSIPQEAHGNVGNAHVSVYYHSLRFEVGSFGAAWYLMKKFGLRVPTVLPAWSFPKQSR